MTRSAADLFHEARELPVEQRAAYLLGACGKDLGLRGKVEALLEADSEAQGGGPTPPLDAVPTQEVSGAELGRYKLLEQIGEGGMGTVWMAEQREPVKRRVALKIIKLGMDSKQVIARFEAERQALAMMDHPNIAKVFDAGATDGGRLYFVMEYIKGIPILKYCDQAKLDTRTRLELFSDVCHAIQHAHQKGIIHRDIKPDNVLVTLHDGVPVVKVIDFGIAKATNQELTQKTLFTEHHQIIGTPAYMSPEQAEMSGLDIDTRSDIYSLGVLLYELLTGTTPFDIRDLLSRGLVEMMRTIREVEPHKPSTRISTLGEAAQVTAQQRHVETKKLSTLLRGDLDWIVMKCLEKDRSRRYETASGLADDIQHHLNDEPVTAGAPSASYRLRKFVKRNRASVTAAAIVGVTVIAGIIGTTSGMLWALNERDRADENAVAAQLAATAESKARAQAVASADAAQQAAERVEHELVRANEAKRFITEMLGAVAPQVAQGRDTTLMRELLDGAAARLDAGEITDERIGFELRLQLGTTYLNLSELDRAEAQLGSALQTARRVLGDDDHETFLAIGAMGLLREEQGRLDEAEALYREAVEGRRRVFGDDHPNTLNTIAKLGYVLMLRGKYAGAQELYSEALEGSRRVLGDDHPATLDAINYTGLLLERQGQYDAAEPYFRDALEGFRTAFGNDHPDTLGLINNLGLLLKEQGQYDEAEVYLLEGLEGYRRVFGDDHPSTLNSVLNMGQLLQAQGKYDEAEPLYREATEDYRRVLGDEHPRTLSAINNTGMLLMRQGKYGEAEPYLREALEGNRRALGADHPSTLAVITNLGMLLGDLGRDDEAEPFVREALEANRRVLGNDHPNTLTALSNLGLLLLGKGEYDAAEPYLLEVLEGSRRVLGADHPDTLNALNTMGLVLLAQGKFDAAEPYLLEALDSFRRVLGASHSDTLGALASLGYLFMVQGQYVEAEAYYREALGEYARVYGEDSQHVASLRSLLCQALIAQAQFAEAETLLLANVAQHDKQLPENRNAANLAGDTKQLVKLYEAWGKPAQAEEWRAQLDQGK